MLNWDVHDINIEFTILMNCDSRMYALFDMNTAIAKFYSNSVSMLGIS